MPRALRAPMLGVAALALLVACSLEGLDRFSFPACPQCDVLNARDHLDPTDATVCTLWQCVIAL